MTSISSYPLSVGSFVFTNPEAMLVYGSVGTSSFIHGLVGASNVVCGGSTVELSGYYTVHRNSNTELAGSTAAYNKEAPPASYTFITTFDIYQEIFSKQCARVGMFIYDSLEKLDRSDDDNNEEIIEHIANVIDIVGEPAVYTAALEANFLYNNNFAFERLLLAIATSSHKETEAYRLELLRGYADNPDYRTRLAAVRALARMKTDGAKSELQKISSRTERGEIPQMAAALLR